MWFNQFNYFEIKIPDYEWWHFWYSLLISRMKWSNFRFCGKEKDIYSKFNLESVQFWVWNFLDKNTVEFFTWESYLFTIFLQILKIRRIYKTKVDKVFETKRTMVRFWKIDFADIPLSFGVTVASQYWKNGKLMTISGVPKISKLLHKFCPCTKQFQRSKSFTKIGKIDTRFLQFSKYKKVLQLRYLILRKEKSSDKTEWIKGNKWEKENNYLNLNDDILSDSIFFFVKKKNKPYEIFLSKI